MKTSVKALHQAKSPKTDLDKKKKGDRDNTATTTIVRVKIPRSDIERFTRTTIQKNKRLFRQLARA